MNDGAAVLRAQIFHSTEVCGPEGSPLAFVVSIKGALVGVSIQEDTINVISTKNIFFIFLVSKYVKNLISNLNKIS